jgi:hypothetical protein
VPEPPSPSPDELRDALIRFADLLDRGGVPYMIVGAMAVAIWGRPRATADIDVTVLADAGGLEAIAASAEAAGLRVDRQWLEWQPLLRGFQIRFIDAGLPIDAMRPRDRHEEAAFARRRAIEIGGRALWFVAPDDLILMKLKAGRPRDFEDALAVLAAQRGSLDEGYLTDHARVIGVADELAYLLTEGMP